MLVRPRCRRKYGNILLAIISDKAHPFPRGRRAGRACKVLLAAFLNCSDYQMGHSELSCPENLSFTSLLHQLLDVIPYIFPWGPQGTFRWDKMKFSK